MIKDQDSLMQLTLEEKREAKARRMAEKVLFDLKLKRHFCFRCRERKTVASLAECHSTAEGVLKFKYWLCKECTI